MDLTPYVESLGRQLLAVVEAGGPDASALIERLAPGMESAIRLALFEALSAAADEITRDLAPGSVEVRLRGRDPHFVVAAPPAPQPVDGPSERVTADPNLDDGPSVRINVRLPEPLKAAVEEAANREGRSVNAWLVRAASSALRGPVRDTAERPGGRSAQHFTGWVR
ncbi:ribbon-helix-helix protein, CopG family [Pseudonocardia sp. CA-107938]|uniref:ribbon-helix-helix protein, CopG family n=1 Tax=Pseudonocardia sp. CA-107938 TaxID=3240021 RepID=UPI003D949FF0